MIGGALTLVLCYLLSNQHLFKKHLEKHYAIFIYFRDPRPDPDNGSNKNNKNMDLPEKDLDLDTLKFSECLIRPIPSIWFSYKYQILVLFIEHLDRLYM